MFFFFLLFIAFRALQVVISAAKIWKIGNQILTDPHSNIERCKMEGEKRGVIYVYVKKAYAIFSLQISPVCREM